MPAGPVPFEKVLADETEEIRKSRERRLGRASAPGPEETAAAAIENGGDAQTATTARNAYKDAFDARFFGLAFSGGGIRSATFNLGILQALGELDILRWVDYLSTVSGGGYIGSWLAAWIRGHRGEEPPTSVKEIESVIASKPGAPSARPVQKLRLYSNYLTPRVGFFGADTWTLITIYLRNVILNQAILASVIAAVLLLPRFVARPFVMGGGDFRTETALCALGLLFGGVFIGLNLRLIDPVEVSPAPAQASRSRRASARSESAPFYATQGGIQVLIVLPMLSASYAASKAAWFFVMRPGADGTPWSGFWLGWLVPTIAAALLLLFAGFAGARKASRLPGSSNAGKQTRVRTALIVIMATGVPVVFGAVLLRCLTEWFILLKPEPSGPWHALVWGAPAMVGAFSLMIVLHLGLMGRELPDSVREWWSRLAAWLFIYLLGFAIVAAVAVYGPLVLALGARTVMGLSLAWAGTTIGGMLAGRSGSTGAKSDKKWAQALAQAAPYVFITGLLLAFAAALQLFLPCSDTTGSICAVRDGFLQVFSSLSLRDITTDHFLILTAIENRLGAVAVVFAGLVAIALLLGWRVDINDFSMHHFYRNRLVRCYLGASHHRREQPFTAFDPHDDITLADLKGDHFTGPYPIVNATLNLTSGGNLAWQQRKGASFVFTPWYCGYQLQTGVGPGFAGAPGYRHTQDYAYPLQRGISLGTAMAISGAAASPNEGYHSSPATAFLMTMFDVRLGAWLGNPARNKFGRSAPRLALYCLMRELFGLTDETSNFVYLSDGGHFENLGIYELVRRRCRYIVACDADQDGDLDFEDLGNAIRKCRTDLGVDIDIDIDSIQRQPASPFSRWHCALGKIHYGADSGDGEPRTGTLVYIKSSLTGDEPEDVLSYSRERTAFPHQSTADQWFDESQFESYRKLGYHAALTTLGVTSQCRPIRDGLESFFVALQQSWYPPSAAVATSFTRHAEDLDRLFERLREDPNLSFMDAQIYPEWRQLMSGAAEAPPIRLSLPADAAQLRAGFYFCNSLIQLMESVYLDLRLDEEYAHPDNRGWMNLFKHWSWSAMFRVTWAICASTYGARFQTFCRRRLGLDAGVVRTPEPDEAAAAQLNFRETALLRVLRAQYPVLAAASVQLVQVEVPDFASESSGPHAPVLTFTAGFGVVHERRLVLFRVQDHLRETGLARKALARLREEGIGFNPEFLREFPAPDPNHPDADIRSELYAMGRPRNLERFEQLFQSVSMRSASAD